MQAAARNAAAQQLQQRGIAEAAWWACSTQGAAGGSGRRLQQQWRRCSALRRIRTCSSELPADTPADWPVLTLPLHPTPCCAVLQGARG